MLGLNASDDVRALKMTGNLTVKMLQVLVKGKILGCRLVREWDDGWAQRTLDSMKE